MLLTVPWFLARPRNYGLGMKRIWQISPCQGVLGGRVDMEGGKCQYGEEKKLTKVPW